MKLDEESRADKIVEELKKEHWEELYNKDNMAIQQMLPPAKDRKWQYYIHEWVVNNTRKKDYVLEVASGMGALCYLLKKAGRFPTGIDVSQTAIDSSKRDVPGVVFTKMYAEKLEFQNNFFDCVCANQLLEHVKEPKIVISEMLRVLKPKGKLLITVPILYNLDLNGKSHHIHHWGFYEIMHLFEEFGDNFKVYWLNKFRRIDEGTGEPKRKNCFGIIFIKNGGKNGRN